MKLRSYWYLIEGSALVSAAVQTVRLRFGSGTTSQQFSVLDDVVVTSDSATIAIGGGDNLANRFVAVNTDDASVSALYNGASSGIPLSAAKSAIISAIDSSVITTDEPTKTDTSQSSSNPTTFKDALTTANLRRVATAPTPNEVLAAGAGALFGLLIS